MSVHASCRWRFWACHVPSTMASGADCGLLLCGVSVAAWPCATHQVCCGLFGCCTTKRCINNATTGFEPRCCGDDCNIGQSLNCCPGGQVCYNVTGQTVSRGLRRRGMAACVDAAEHYTSDPGVGLHLLAHILFANCPHPFSCLQQSCRQARLHLFMLATAWH